MNTQNVLHRQQLKKQLKLASDVWKLLKKNVKTRIIVQELAEF
jgi:hypothetical protein